MLVRLIILWLLSEQPHHGYRIRKILDDEAMRFWFPIEDASIYSMLRTLTKSGYVQRMESERLGRRPLRTPYAITPKGWQHYRDLLREAWQSADVRTDPVQVCLAAGGDLEGHEIDSLRMERHGALEQRLSTLEQLRTSAPDEAMVDRERARVEGELTWLKRLISGPSQDLAKGNRSMTAPSPQIDLICNVVIRGADGQILLARSGSEPERWWLPTRDLVPYEHPDEVAPKVLEDVGGLTAENIRFGEIESFRGRTGWHVMFNYLADVSGAPGDASKFEWFSPEALPPTAHGKWERDVIRRALERL